MKQFFYRLIAIVLVLAMLPTVSFAVVTRTVYLDPVAGADTNSGLSEDSPVKTVAAAYAALSGVDAGTIVFLNTLSLSSLTTFPSSGASVTLTSKTGAEGISASQNIYFSGPTTLENITITSRATNGYTVLSAKGHKFTIGKNVTTVKTATNYFSLCGGSNSSDCSSVDFTVRSGTWHNIYIGSHGKRTVSGDCNVSLSGITLLGSLSVGYQAIVKGNVNCVVTDSTIPSVYACATQTTGSVGGNVTFTLGAGANVTNYTIESGSMSAVKGTNTLILSGGTVNAIKKSSENAASGATSVVLQYGSVNSCKGADEIKMEIPDGKMLFIGGQVEASSVKSAGTLCFGEDATLTAGAVTGTVFCTVDGAAKESHLYVQAPAGSDIRFDSATGIMGYDGQWTVNGAPADMEFVGLILSAEAGVTVTLYNGVAESGRTKVTPVRTVTGERNYYYYEISSGYYHYIASGTGRYKIQKNMYMSATEAAGKTVLDVTPPRLSGDGWEQKTNVKLYTDEVLEKIRKDDPAQWPEYADIFTTPYFTEDRTAYQMTTQDQMTAFISKLDDKQDNLYVFNAGQSSTYGFPIDAVVVTKTDLSSAKTLEEAAALMGQDKPTVFYRAHIHGSEPASGEAALAILQRLDGDLGEKVLDTINLVVIPRNSPDAAYNYERYIPDGTELNRDNMSMEYSETLAYHRIHDLFQPEMVLDGHEFLAPTMGSYIEYDDALIGLGYCVENSKAFEEAYRPLVTQVQQKLTDNGLYYRYYTNLVDTDASASGSRSYSAMQGTMFVLIESHGIANGTEGYHRRVVSQVISMQTIIEYVAENAETVQNAVDTERQRIIQEGATYEETDVIALELGKAEDVSYIHPAIHIYQSGKIVNETIVPQVRNVVVRSRTAPTAYVIPADDSYIHEILALMDKQNISYTFIPAGSQLPLQQYSGTVTDSTVTDVSLSEEKLVTFHNGAYVFCKNQVKGKILSAFMEPDIKQSVKHGLAYRGLIPCTDGKFPIYRYIHDLNGEGFVDYTFAPEAPRGIMALDVTNVGGTGSIVGLDANKCYEYRAETEEVYKTLPAGTTSIDDLTLGGYYVRYCATKTETASTDTYCVIGYALENYTVYLDSATGSDGSEGYTQNTSVATLQQAHKQLAKLLDHAPDGTTGEICIVGTYNITGTQTMPTHSYPLRITGGKLIFTDTTETYKFLRIGGDTTFENITLGIGSKSSSYYLCGEGHKLVIGKNVTSQDNGGSYFNITGGTGKFSNTAKVAETDLTILSGHWQTVYAGGFVSSVTGDARVVLSGCSVASVAASRNGTVSGNAYYSLENMTVRTEIYCGNTQKNNVNGNVTMVLKEGVVLSYASKAIYAGTKEGGSIGGTVTVIADGIDLETCKIYGKCNNTTGTIGGLVLKLNSGKLSQVLDTFVTHEDAVIVLGCAQQEAAMVQKGFMLDLGGFDAKGITVAEGCVLTVFDSATDDYTVLDAQGYGRLTASGTVVAKEGYVSVDSSTFHRFTQAITGVSVRPASAGMYYGATWWCDEVLMQQVESFGVAVSLQDMPGAEFDQDTRWTSFAGKDFLCGKEATGVLIDHILKDGADNQSRGTQKIYAASYVVLKDGTKLLSHEAVSYSLCDVMQLLDEKAYAENMAALEAFYARWEDPMANWNFVNIGKQ